MRIQESDQQSWTTKITQRLHTKLGFGVAIGALLLGGTAAALTLWPTPSVTQTTIKDLPSGNHIVSYDTKNCNYFGKLDGIQPKTSDEKVYYEVREGSKMTDSQLQASLQGVCEENISNNAISAVEKSLPINKRGDSTAAYTITAISSNSITISLDPHYNAANYVTKPNQTYTRFDSGLVVYNESAKGSFANLKAGDTIKMITKNTSGKGDSQGYEPSNHPEDQIVEAIVKIPALTADPTAFDTGVAREFVRADPCTTSPTGFCRAYDFAK